MRLGCFFTYIPEQFPIKEKAGIKEPEEYQCHFRSTLHHSFDQRDLRPNRNSDQSEIDRHDVWFIDSEGKHVERCVEDAARQIMERGLAWFERLSDPKEVLRTLLEDGEKLNETSGFGRNPSPIRSYMAGYAAARLGNNKLADEKFDEAVKSGCFKALFTSSQKAKSRLHRR